jgi:hypothetical protein
MSNEQDGGLRTSHLIIYLKFATYGRSKTVEKLAKLQTARVVLHVTGIEVVGYVEDCRADAGLFSSSFGMNWEQ